ncbi:MAG: hypothetical protein K8T20_00310 [Planctomycetes bacterium]|nr:hypothetical protein [Planctomycetota bacterium]
MFGRIRWGLAVACAVLAFASTARAQLVAPVFDGFDTPGTGFDLAGWTVDPASTEGVGWAVDANPANLGDGAGGPGEPSTWPPGAPSLGSLNFNDGTNFEDITDGVVSGFATSPVIDVSGLGGTAVISFKCAIEVEPGSASTNPSMNLYVFDTVGSILYGPLTIGKVGSGAGYEIVEGQWSQCNAYATGFTSIQILFEFDSGDAVSNAFAGMFIDNFRVSCSDVTPPSTPTLVSPIGGITVTNPVTLDWTDSTDSSACGPGGISGYQIQIDDDPLFGSVNFNFTSEESTTTVSGIPGGTWYWRVRALDEQDMNSGVPPPAPTHPGAFSTGDSFFIEPPLSPLAPDTLFVNIPALGAQSGLGGFVDPVLSELPVFSAIYRDGNTIDNALSYRFQVSQDPTFTVVDYDSFTMGISPLLPKDARCVDVQVGISLLRDTTYHWRIQFTDGGGLTGPFSSAQSFRIGDDYQFGVRVGSTHHGRKKCWVATAATGSTESTPVQSLQAWRFGTMESNGAGKMVSRAYHVIGAEASTVTGRSSVIATVLGPVGALLGGAGSMIALFGIAILAAFGCTRLFGRA